jgi:hypothetical protein
VKYSVMEDAPLDAVARAIRVLLTCALDWDMNIPSMVAHASAVVSAIETGERISHEREDSR